MEKTIPMRVVKKRTGLTARQIRYYDDMDLINPDRSQGNQRLFSENDIDLLKEIKKLIENGYTVSSIKNILDEAKEEIESGTIESEEGIKPIEDTVKRKDYQKDSLTSLYPVSDRSQLIKILTRKKQGEE